mmetsp:Transcript_72710/g.158747  ORF Transcript_72710/g.158747 Transcript_72710/m.158747 type:complete len:90 (-) Transcript_72710:1062-1331(-)
MEEEEEVAWELEAKEAGNMGKRIQKDHHLLKDRVEQVLAVGAEPAAKKATKKRLALPGARPKVLAVDILGRIHHLPHRHSRGRLSEVPT